MSMLKCVYSSRAAPAIEPVTVNELDGPLRIDYDDDDQQLSNLITEARNWAEENILGRALVNQTVTEKFDGFSDNGLELRWQPVQSITSITYVDSDGTTQTLSTDYYELGSHLGINYIRLKYSQSWPTTRNHEEVVTVTYVAGYGATAASVPQPIRQAIIAYVHYRYDGALDSQYLAAAKSLLAPYSVRR